MQAVDLLWTQSAGANQYWRSIAYGGGVVVTAGRNLATQRAVTQFSLDGGQSWNAPAVPINWTGMSQGVPEHALFYGNGRFLCMPTGVSGNNTVAYSLNGDHWVTVDNTVSNVFPSGILGYGAGNFFVQDDGNAQFALTADGVTFNRIAQPAPGSGFVAFNSDNGRILILHSAGATACQISIDGGHTWTAGGAPANGNGGLLAFGNGVYVAAQSGNFPNLIYSADNGISWHNGSILNGGVNYSFSSLVFTGQFFVAIPMARGGVATDEVWLSQDGVNWFKSAHRMPTISATSYQTTLSAGGIVGIMDSVGGSSIIALGAQPPLPVGHLTQSLSNFTRLLKA